MEQVHGPIHTIPKDDETYNSSTIHSFKWRPRNGSEEFDKGQLIVTFRDNPDNPDIVEGTPSSAYAYNVPKKAFGQLKYRAYNITREDSQMTAGEWFNNRLAKYVDWTDRKNGDLYLSKIKL